MKEHATNLRFKVRTPAIPGEQSVRGSLDLHGFTAQSTSFTLLTS